jgi:hypothetical protein
MLSWPVQFSDYVLQRNDDLNTISWVPDMTASMTNAASTFILVDPAASQRLYRLSKP